MDKRLEPIVQALQQKFGVTFEEFRDEVHVFVTAEQIVAALTLLRDDQDFALLSALTAVDSGRRSRRVTTSSISSPR